MQRNMIERRDINLQKALLRERGICIVIPTYNNVGTIEDVVLRAKGQCDDVIVVNDGSTDGTEEVLHRIDGITTVIHSANKGKGEALKSGLSKARNSGYAYAITLDADGQHFPEDIPLLLDANRKHPGAIIVGQRKELEKAERSAGSKFANSFSNFWFCVQTGKYLKDTQTGYRLYPIKKLHGLSFLTSRYEAELELLVFSCWHGIPIYSVPINVYYPPKEERVSHFRPGYDFSRISILNTCLCFLSIVYGYPLKIIRGLLVGGRTLYSLLVYLLLCVFVLLPSTFFLKCVKMEPQKRSLKLHAMLYTLSRWVMSVHGIPGVKYQVDNQGETFKDPAVIICNHQSHLDLMMMLSQTKKIVVLTNDWVWKSPFYGYVIRHAEFYPVSWGIDVLLPKLESLVKRGYCIAVYPEGTRSRDCHIGRFHKGAFHIAKALQLDILPFVEYGAGFVLPKGGKHLRKGEIKLTIKDRIKYKEYMKIGTEQEISSWFKNYYVKEYSSLCNKLDQDA